VAVISMLVPATWAAAVALGIWWGAGNPWSWVAPVVLVRGGTLALSRPVCRMVRFLVARWTGTVVPAGYRQAGPVTRMSTGYWWNGFSYERTRRDALLDQKWRVRWSDPANWRDLRFTAIAPLTAGVAASLPPTGVAVAVLGLGQSFPQDGVGADQGGLELADRRGAGLDGRVLGKFEHPGTLHRTVASLDPGLSATAEHGLRGALGIARVRPSAPAASHAVGPVHVEAAMCRASRSTPPAQSGASGAHSGGTSR
jgi:hypothetical protein